MITDEHDLKVWTAGIVEGCGMIDAHIAVGVTGKEYAAIDLYVDVKRPSQADRLIRAAHNGVFNEAELAWELGGIAAVRGFLESIWTWLSPESKTYFNEGLRRFKELKKLAS